MGRIRYTEDDQAVRQCEDLKAYQRAWYHRHRERLLEAARNRQAAYRKKHPRKVKKALASWYQKNKEKQREYKRLWKKRNKAKVAAASRRYRDKRKRSPKRLARVRRKWAEYALYWRLRNPLLSKAKLFIGRVRKRKRKGHVTIDTLLQKMAFYGNRCVYCGASDDLSIDHVKPLSKGGSNLVCNFVPCCLSCNSRKQAQWDGVSTWIRCRDYGLS